MQVAAAGAVIKPLPESYKTDPDVTEVLASFGAIQAAVEDVRKNMSRYYIVGRGVWLELWSKDTTLSQVRLSSLLALLAMAAKWIFPPSRISHYLCHFLLGMSTKYTFPLRPYCHLSPLQLACRLKGTAPSRSSRRACHCRNQSSSNTFVLHLMSLKYICDRKYVMTAHGSCSAADAKRISGVPSF